VRVLGTVVVAVIAIVVVPVVIVVVPVVIVVVPVVIVVPWPSSSSCPWSSSS
jgi:hypothetical protein